MQRVRALVGPINLRTLPMHLVAREARRNVERIAFVWPPTIDAHREILAVCIPIAARALFVELGELARIADVPAKFVGQDYVVEHYSKMVLMQLSNHLFRIGKHLGVP